MPPAEKWIALVEDSPGERELFAQALARQGLADRLVWVESADTLLRLLQSADRTAPHPLPHLILLDLRLKEERGLDCLTRLKGDRAFAGVPVVVLTTSDCPEDMVACYRHGAAGYVVKPDTFERLLALTGALCRYWLEWNEPGPCAVGPAAARSA